MIVPVYIVALCVMILSMMDTLILIFEAVKIILLQKFLVQY